MKQKTLLILVLVLVVLLGGAYALYQGLGENLQPEQLQENTQPPTEASPEASNQPTEATTPTIPNVTLYDARGNAVQLSDFFGKPIVLNFWASWCGPCKSEMPVFEEKSKQLEGQVQFLMVNMTDGKRETVDQALKFIHDAGYTFPVLYDTGREAMFTYGISSYPTTFFIDAQGRFTTWAMGAINAETLQKGIDMIYTPTQG